MGFTERVLIWIFFKFIFILSLRGMVYGEPQVPCYFIFGDSLVDNGNNNDLETQAKANFPPYGIDFPDGPTGRFTNGRNIADIIAQLLGFDKYIPPFATASGKDILSGVNYGSGSAGILDETGQHMGARISMNQQLENHQITISRLTSFLGSKKLVSEYLKKCMYTVGMGNNDYINNYVLPQYYSTSRMYTPDRYAATLIHQYSQQLKTLYKYGARTVGIFGVGYLGCTPGEISIYGADESSCVDKINDAAISFNHRLEGLIDDLNYDLADAKFIFIDPLSRYDGPRVKVSPCCQILRSVSEGQCAINTIPCTNRSDHVFWDAFHPTEAAVLDDGAHAYAAMVPLYASFSLDTRIGELSKPGVEYISYS